MPPLPLRERAGVRGFRPVDHKGEGVAVGISIGCWPTAVFVRHLLSDQLRSQRRSRDTWEHASLTGGSPELTQDTQVRPSSLIRQGLN